MHIVHFAQNLNFSDLIPTQGDMTGGAKEEVYDHWEHRDIKAVDRRQGSQQPIRHTCKQDIKLLYM